MEQKKSIWKKFLEWTGLSSAVQPTEDEKCAVVSLVKNTYNLYDTYQKANEDKNITLREWFGIGRQSLPLAGSIKNWQGVREDIQDFDFGKGRELKQWIISKGVFKEDAEETIKLIYGYIEYQYIGWVQYGEPLLNKLKKITTRRN